MLDTNVALDLLVFGDPSAVPLRAGLRARRLRWLATQAMRDELERVLGYAQIAGRLAAGRITVVDVLELFDRHACMVDAPPRAAVSCSDPDDQIFIDLAVHHGCTLLSKDAAVLALKARLAAMQVTAAAALAAPSCSLSGS